MRLFPAALGIAAIVEDDGRREWRGRVARDVELKMPSRMEQFRGSCDAARSRVVGIRALPAGGRFQIDQVKHHQLAQAF